jgi:hypothetical protein
VRKRTAGNGAFSAAIAFFALEVVFGLDADGEEGRRGQEDGEELHFGGEE